MLNRVSSFLKNLASPASSELENSISVEIACAVLLCEVMCADHHIDSDEKTRLADILKAQFKLNQVEANEMIEHALAKSSASNDLYTYTSAINQQYCVEDKITLVNALWQVALADGEISAIEHHIIRKIADLLHLRHSEYIASKADIS